MAGRRRSCRWSLPCRARRVVGRGLGCIRSGRDARRESGILTGDRRLGRHGGKRDDPRRRKQWCCDSRPSQRDSPRSHSWPPPAPLSECDATRRRRPMIGWGRTAHRCPGKRGMTLGGSFARAMTVAMVLVVLVSARGDAQEQPPPPPPPVFPTAPPSTATPTNPTRRTTAPRARASTTVATTTAPTTATTVAPSSTTTTLPPLEPVPSDLPVETRTRTPAWLVALTVLSVMINLALLGAYLNRRLRPA